MEAYGALARIGRSYQWWLGDLLTFADGHFDAGEVSQVLSGVDYSEQSLSNCKWVASRYPMEQRRRSLSFALHAELAALEDDEREEWLDRCEEEGWSREQLRAKRREEKQAKLPPAGEEEEKEEREPGPPLDRPPIGFDVMEEEGEFVVRRWEFSEALQDAVPEKVALFFGEGCERNAGIFVDVMKDRVANGAPA